MQVNGTFLGELIIFCSFYFFVKTKIWPKFAGVLEERKVFIENGLAAARDGQSLLEDAEKNAQVILKKAQEKAEHLLEVAQGEAIALHEQAREEIDQLKSAAQKELVLMKDNMRNAFMREARHHYLEIAKGLCSKIFEDQPDLYSDALERVLSTNTFQNRLN